MKRNFFSLLTNKSVLSLAVGSLAVLTLTGCGFGPAVVVSAPQAVVLPAISGVVMGGETPVSGANVILWETDPGNTGYGVATNGSAIGAQQLASTTGGANGAFSFTAGSYTCAPGQFAYITSTGGDASDGGGTEINNNLVLIAALGSCSNFSSTAAENNIKININELSTVAAAYALGNFATVNVNGNVGTQLVYIGAPSTNNASTGSCTGTGTSMSCNAAGLAHAFANAATLVDAVHYDGTAPTGLARTTVPGNASGSVPQAVINSLGDIMSYCTQSASSGTGGTNCTTFFNDAKPANTTAPTDTFSAMMNIAHFPQNNRGTTCTGQSGGLFCLISGIAAPWPALTAVPHDWSIGIVYAGDTGGSFSIPQYVALDANDNVYVEYGNLHTATLLGEAAMTSSGGTLWNNALSANQCTSGALTVDTNGNLFMSIASSTSGACSYGVNAYSTSTGSLTYQFSAPSGTVCGQASPSSSNCPGYPFATAGTYDTAHPVQSQPTGLAIDRLNNLWYNRSTGSCTTCLQKLPFSGSNYSTATVSEGTNWNGGNNIVLDPTGNVFSSSFSAHLFVVPNTSPSTPNAPTYTNTTGSVDAAPPSAAFGLAALDSAGNIWTAYASNFAEYTPTVNGSNVVTGFSAGSSSPFNTAGTSPEAGEFDGHDNLFSPSFTTSGLIYMQTSPSAPGYNASNTTSFTMNPCYVPAGATTCTATVSTSDPRNIQIDSTGSIWVAATGATSAAVPGFVVQIIGTAWPTWPQMSYSKFGVTP